MPKSTFEKRTFGHKHTRTAIGRFRVRFMVRASRWKKRLRIYIYYLD